MSASSETPIDEPPSAGDESSKAVSKKAAKKEAAKQEKLRRRQEAAAEAAISSLNVEDDPLSANYGDVPLSDLQSKEAKDIENWTQVGSLTGELKDKYVILRGRIQTIRAVGKKMAFLVVRERGFTVQCVVSEQPELVSRQMVKYVDGLSRESIVDVEGVVSVPNVAIKGATQQVEIQVRKVYCISKAMPTLPINIEDAARSEAEIEKALQVYFVIDLFWCDLLRDCLMSVVVVHILMIFFFFIIILKRDL